jgi:hypothetical protein
MTKRIPTFQRLTLAVAVATLSSLVFAAPAQAQTNTWKGVCVGENLGNLTAAEDVATILGLQCLIANVLSVALTFIGLAGFVMIVVGAFRYMLSGSNAKGADAARSTVTFAIGGLVVAVSAFIVLNLISAYTGISTFTNFKLTVDPP